MLVAYGAATTSLPTTHLQELLRCYSSQRESPPHQGTEKPQRHIRFPVAERRKERMLKDQDFNAPEETPELVDSHDESMFDLVDTSDDEGDDAEANEPSADVEARPNAKAQTPSAGAKAPTAGIDSRGLGLETFDGSGERQEL